MCSIWFIRSTTIPTVRLRRIPICPDFYSGWPASNIRKEALKTVIAVFNKCHKCHHYLLSIHHISALHFIQSALGFGNFKISRSIRYCHRLISAMTDQSESDTSIRNHSEPSVRDEDLSSVQEGKAIVYNPKSVFYNPVQEFNRDLTIAVISEYAKEHFEKQKLRNEKSVDRKLNKNEPNSTQTDEKVTESHSEEQGGEITQPERDVEDSEKLVAGRKYENGIRILEGLAASGLRSIRFGLEIPGVKEIVANDFDRGAVKIIQKNIEKNDLGEIVHANYGDAAMVMYQNKGYKDRFHVIDLDPYGTAAPFLDAAVQAVADDGLLCVTCTDMAVLCGVAGETCYSKYGAMSLRAKHAQFVHEMALRILLQCVESHANRYSRYIVPLISVSADFYIRVFMKVFSGQGKVKRSASKMSMVYNCTGCGSFHLQKLGVCIPTKGDNFKYSPGTGPPVGQSCDNCGFKFQLGGPFWAAEIHDVNFVTRVIQSVTESMLRFKTAERIVGVLSVISEELQDVPLYYITDDIFSVVHSSMIPLLDFRSSLLNAGYRVSSSHAAKNSQKTDAPPHVIWDIVRTWVKDHPVSEKRLKEGTPARAILKKEPSTEVSFKAHPDANPKSRRSGLKRFQENPEPEWGPKARAKSEKVTETLQERREKNQGKRKGIKRGSDEDTDTQQQEKRPHSDPDIQDCP